MQEEYTLCTIDDLGTIGRGKSKHRPRNDPSLFGGKYPFIQTGDVKHADFYITDFSDTYNEKGLAQSKLWPVGTLCITIAANIAETAILSFPACFPDSIIGFLPDKSKSDLKFVKYCLDAYKLQIQSISHGTTQDNLSAEKLRTIKLKAPPLPTQKKIAAVLSAYDDLIENNTRRIALLEGMAEELYKEWFVRLRFPGCELALFEKGVPQKWSVGKVEDIIKRIPPGKKYEQKTVLEFGSVPILDQGRSGIIGYHNNEPGVFASFNKPIIVFANHTCYQRLIFHNFSAIQNVLPFKPKSETSYDIFWLHYATKDLIEFIEYKGHWPAFMKKGLFLPDSKLTQKFGELVKPFLQQKENFLQQIDVLKATRNRLLTRLISGKLSVEDLDIAFPPSMQDEQPAEAKQLRLSLESVEV